MAIIHVDETTVGLPNSGRLSGTNGDLVGIMDVALPLNGWAIEYTTGNARIYRPGTGNRFRLHMYDDSAVSGSATLCLVRGCENASDATTLVDPFPLVSQVANGLSNWHKSSAVSTTARAFDIWVGETFVIYACNYGGTTDQWVLEFFGDFAPALIGDGYNAVCTVRNSASTGGNPLWPAWIATSQNGVSTMYLCRSYDGTVKSTRSGIPGKYGQAALGILNSGMPTMQSGPTSGIDTDLCALYDTGSASGGLSSSLALPIRGWLPNILSPQHGGRGSVGTRYSYAATPYMATGKVVTTTSNQCVVIQESDDWVSPAPV
jgi:hypothetical protein